MTSTTKGDAGRLAPMKPACPPAEYRSEDLLKSQRQIVIVHRGQRYILRETRAGKLILYK